jgi:hypothetical protein
MSRFSEGDGDWDNAWMWEGWRNSALSGKRTHAELVGFLVHLDSMPIKRIGVSAFITKEGDYCTVAEYCRFKGLAQEKLEHYKKLSQGYINEEIDEQEDGWDSGPTVQAGHEAGLPKVIAYELGSYNDLSADCKWIETEGPINSFYQHPHLVRIELTPEERWIKVRNHIAGLVAEGKKLQLRKQRKLAKV